MRNLANKQTNKQTNRQTNKQTNKHTKVIAIYRFSGDKNTSSSETIEYRRNFPKTSTVFFDIQENMDQRPLPWGSTKAV